jgi:O-acetylhomoserine (thiol)-lyase
MTHSHLTPRQLADAGIGPTTIRLSLGLEDPADILADLDAALVWTRAARATVGTLGA